MWERHERDCSNDLIQIHVKRKKNMQQFLCAWSVGEEKMWKIPPLTLVVKCHVLERLWHHLGGKSSISTVQPIGC